LGPAIDFHLHPAPESFPGPQECFHFLEKEFKANSIEKGVLLQLNSQPWSREAIGSALASRTCIIGFVSVHPLEKDAPDKLAEYLERFPYKGLKLHPRLDRFEVNDPKTVELVRLAGRKNVPVLIDAFPDGTSLMGGFEPKDYALLCHQCKDTNIVVAHFGGVRVLDFLLLAKRTPNMFFNTAYSLLYFRGSSVTQDLVYAIKSLRGKRVFYGSDYPDRGLGETLRLSVEEFSRFGLSEEMTHDVLYGNAREFLASYGL